MAYVERNSEGQIKGCYANPQSGYAEELLADDDEEVVAFREAQNARLSAMGLPS